MAKATRRNTDDNPILAAALAYVDRGWHVFPADLSDGQKKSHKSAKRSNGANWGMTRDPDEIRRDFSKPGRDAIGIPTGAINGVFVVETDTVEGHDVDGLAALKQLEAEHGALPDTLMAESPTGSIHRYFQHPGINIKSSAGRLGPGIDVKGDGGMVIAPPSLRPGKGEYRWLNDAPIAAAPVWLITPCTDPDQEQPEHAAYMLLARAWPADGKGKHDAALTVGGFLARLGRTPDEVGSIVADIATAMGETERAKELERTARGAAEAHAKGKHTRGLPVLIETFGQEVAERVAGWLGYDERNSGPDFQLDLRYGADLDPQAVDWLWPGHIPAGRVTLLVGLPAAGKSHVFCDICARVTTGRNMPPDDGPSLDPPGNVLIVCTEDRPEDTLVPRIMAAGGDKTRAIFVPGLKASDGNRRGLDLTQDIGLIETCLAQHPDVTLIVFDPINEFFGFKIDGNNNNAIRAALGPLNELLGRTGKTAIGVTHLPKVKTGAVQTAAIGSIAMSAGPRGSLLVTDEEEEAIDDDGDCPGRRELTGRKLLAVSKGNLAAPSEQTTLIFELESITLSGKDGEEIATSRVKWLGVKDVSAHDLWQGQDKHQKLTKKYQATKFIRQAMRDPDQPDRYRNRLSAEIIAEAGAAGISEKTLKRAKSELGIESEQDPADSKVWWWVVPPIWNAPKF